MGFPYWENRFLNIFYAKMKSTGKFIQCSLNPLYVTLVFLVFIVSCTNEAGVLNGTQEKKVKEGVLSGRVIQYPISPVEGMNMPSSKPVSGIKLMLLTLTGQEINSLVTDNDGQYSIFLPPGSYRVEMSRNNADKRHSRDLPATVTVKEESETRLDIRIDTGIR